MMTPKAIRVAWLIAIAIGATGDQAWAGPITPYSPTAAEIQSMFDRTADFSGGAQASSAIATNVPGGVLLDITWSTGARFINETFTRIVRVQRFPADDGDGDGGDLDAFDGAAWMVTSSIPLVGVKPFSQPYGSFNFYEGTQDFGCDPGVICIPANTPTLVALDWNMVNFGGSIPLAERGNIFEIGFQVFGPVLPQDGSTIGSTLLITAVPEPGSMILIGTGVLVLWRSRSQRKGMWVRTGTEPR